MRCKISLDKPKVVPLYSRHEKGISKMFAATRAFLEKKFSPDAKKTYPPRPQEIVTQVRKALAEDDIVTLDNGIYKLWFSRLYRTFKPNTFLVDNALATMGAGLSAGIAAKLVHPERKVLAVVGDGGFMMNSQELETALRHKIPLVVLILNDNAYGFIKWKQQAKGFPNFALDYGNPDFVKYAESYGAVGIKLRDGDDLSSVLHDAFAQEKLVVVECPIDYSLNYETFSRDIEHIVCEI